MSFGDELNAEFESESRKITGKCTEERLFKAMEATFENLRHKCSLRCAVIHGGKLLVDFEETASDPFHYANDAICPSVGAYGVFYNYGGKCGMIYHSANVLGLVTPKAKGRRRKVIMNPWTSKLTSYIRGGVK